MRTLTREQVREVDRLAIQELGIPGVVLMENAGRGAADAAIDLLRRRRRSATRGRALILCGGGNNGGDGYVIARHLHNRGVSVTIAAAVEPAKLTGDAAVHAAVAQRMGLMLRLIDGEAALREAQEATAAPPALVVDALLGTGFRGQVREPIAGPIRWCNALRAQGAAVLAVDVPSGLDCDTGEAADDCVEADVTVTFVAAKVGMRKPRARRYVGRLIVADIGTPPELIDRAAGASDEPRA